MYRILNNWGDGKSSAVCCGSRGNEGMTCHVSSIRSSLFLYVVMPLSFSQHLPTSLLACGDGGVVGRNPIVWLCDGE